MAVVFDKLVTPAYSDYRKVRPHSKVAIGVGLVALMIAMAVLAVTISSADDLNSGGLDTTKLLAFGFGLQTLALVTLKFGIGIALVGILVRLVHRIDSVNASLGALRPAEHGSGPAVGALATPYGAAQVTNTPPWATSYPQDGKGTVVPDACHGPDVGHNRRRHLDRVVKQCQY